MSDFEPTGTFEEQVELSSLDNIKAQGISIRVGGQIIRFVADDVQDILVEDEVRNEFKEAYNEEIKKLHKQVDELKSSLKDQVRKRNTELDRRERDLQKKLRENVSLPTITEDILKAGVSVARKDHGRGYLWSMICVYAPKFANEKIIEPSFAKRLMTPIRIFVYTDENWCVTDVKLVKLINCEKFLHYHSRGDRSDCWGEFRFSGELIDTPEKALNFFRNVQNTLETVNRMSIGNRSPKGLPRLTTLEKNLLEAVPQETKGKTSTNRRYERAGFDETVNSGESTDTWSTI